MSLALVPLSLPFYRQITHFAAQHWYDYVPFSAGFNGEVGVRRSGENYERNSGNTDSHISSSP